MCGWRLPNKPLVWRHGEVKSPPLSAAARVETGYLLRQLQAGRRLEMPHSRPMPMIGARCHELRVPDERATWRLVYRLDADAVVILEVFGKKTEQTPKDVLDACRGRLRAYDAAVATRRRS